MFVISSKSLGILSIIHDGKDLTIKKARQVWDIICSNSDGIDVESWRTKAGLLNNDEDILSVIKGLVYVSKSKLMSYRWDKKQFQLPYVMGFKGTYKSEEARYGTNSHLVQECIPTFITKDNLDEAVDNNVVKSYITDTSKEVVKMLIENTLNKEFRTFEDAVLELPREDQIKYKETVGSIASNYERRAYEIKEIYGIKDLYNRLVPVYTEAFLINKIEYINGIIDAIFDNSGMRNNFTVVDYKFGSAKEYYYMPAIELELTYYKILTSLKGTIRQINDSNGLKREIEWKPMFVESGEMWHLLDEENGRHVVQFKPKHVKTYYDAVQDYWTALDTLSYDFQPEYGYQKDRYENFCNKVVFDKVKQKNRYNCMLRRICETSDSFKKYEVWR